MVPVVCIPRIVWLRFVALSRLVPDIIGLHSPLQKQAPAKEVLLQAFLVVE